MAGLDGGRGKRWEKEVMVGPCRLLEEHRLSLRVRRQLLEGHELTWVFTGPLPSGCCVIMELLRAG